MAVSLEGDRIFSLTAYESLRKSNKEAVELLFWQELIPGFIGAESHEAWWRGLVSREWYCRVWRFTWSHQDERNCMKRLQQLIEIARDAAAKKSYAEVSPVIESFQEDCLGGFYDQLRFPSSSQSALTLAVSLRRAMRAETERSLVIGAIALKRYSLRHGRLPDTLDALVPEFLSSVPVDYMDGKPLKYRSNGDGTFRLYSVGANFIDDGGDATLLPDEIHARAPWARKDVVWPMPATAEELDAYRKESAKN
jgi:hypothetical protein